MEASPKAAPEALCSHFLAAGEPKRAGRYGLLAADAASTATAYDHAAKFYQIALDSDCLSADDRPRVLCRQADTLANAGRCVEAAEGYSMAAKLLEGTEALETQVSGSRSAPANRPLR